MPRRASVARLAWEDRFCTPTLAQLMAGLSKEHTCLLNHARKSVLSAAPGEEFIRWHGVPWRWTLVFREAGMPRPWAYLIPQPAHPRIALPLSLDLVASFPMRGASRYLRDGLIAAPRVAGTCWAQWDLLTHAQTDELVELARHRLEQSLAPVA